MQKEVSLSQEEQKDVKVRVAAILSVAGELGYSDNYTKYLIKTLKSLYTKSTSAASSDVKN